MQWHFVNAMTFETATHRIRRICTARESYWLAERKATGFEHLGKICGKFETQDSAQAACESDAYAEASGR